MLNLFLISQVKSNLLNKIDILPFLPILTNQCEGENDVHATQKLNVNSVIETQTLKYILDLFPAFRAWKKVLDEFTNCFLNDRLIITCAKKTKKCIIGGREASYSSQESGKPKTVKK